MTTTKTVYVVVSNVWQGGGVQSTHRTRSGAERAIRKADAAVKCLNRNGGSCYHDCRIEERVAR